MPANFITPPDRVKINNRLKILIIDSTWHDIEALTLMCMTTEINIDFYIFAPTGIMSDWLDNALEIADYILLNNDSNRRDLNNRTVLADARTRLFGTQNCKYAAPLDFVIETIKEE